MKNQKLLIFIVVITFVFILLPVKIAAQESNATLQETLTWIKSKVDFIDKVGALLPKPDYLRGEKPSKEKLIQYFDAGDLQLDTSSQCTLSWRNPDAAKLKTAAEAKSKKPKTLDSISLVQRRSNLPLEISVPLAFLDPEKVEVVSFEASAYAFYGTDITFWAVKMSVTDDAQKIVWNGLENNSGTNSFLLVFKEKQMAERIAKAFRHGIKLCGGKKSGMIKEPF